MKNVILLTIGLILLLGSVASAVAPEVATFQGILRNNLGLLVEDGTWIMVFTIYDSLGAGTTLVWAETLNVYTEGGIFQTVLGNDHPITAAVMADLANPYMGFGVNAGLEMTPKSQLTSAIWSLNATTAESTLTVSDYSITSAKMAPGTLEIDGGFQASGKLIIGTNHTNGGWLSSIAGGDNNNVSGNYSFIGGGTGHNAGGLNSTVGGGVNNSTTATGATVSGGVSNQAGGWGSVGGGYINHATGDYATVAGGKQNTATGEQAVVAGGASNTAGGPQSAVIGGFYNSATAIASFVGGGLWSQATADGAIVGGGGLNEASGLYSGVLGGGNNHAHGDFSVIIGGGGESPVDSNSASGMCSTIPGGSRNYVGASGSFSLAAGYRARASHVGSFIFADSNGHDFTTITDNSFSVRCVGGARFVTGLGETGEPVFGVELAAGSSSWDILSDRNTKENIRELDYGDVLEKIGRIEISEWNYIAQEDNIRHIGPMAQDFFAQFGLGTDEKRISTVDADGVALAAIKALYEQNQTLFEQNDRLERELELIKQMIKKLNDRQPNDDV